MPETTQPEDPIKDHLVCCQTIPLRWRKLDQPLEEVQLQLMQVENAKLMEVLVRSEDAAWEAEQSLDKDAVKELRKIDAKLNLLMGWVGKLMLQQMSAPQPQTVYLSTRGLQFSLDAHAPPIAANEDLFIELFLEPRYPQAFTAVAKVVRIEPSAQVTARFSRMNEPNQQWLDKYVFQVHRRQIALSRKSTES